MGAQAVRLSNVDIDNALKNKDFEVLFQPIFDLGNGALARVETFVRWRHPVLGVLPPGAFISFFESQGRMSELTRYVLGEALVQYCNWRGASAPGFSINLALSDLADDGFAAHFLVHLRDCGFPADLITLECPMPPVTMTVGAAAEYFQRLSQTGARLAIEVRGRANDFLRQIDPFPFDEIKTGGAAILRFARTVRGPGLSAISELLEIASKSNAAITAVGVEDQASLSALRGLGFAAAQGNHLGRVGPLQAFTPSRVNEVRELLGLEPLSSQDLQALFRTEAPAPQPSPPPSAASPAVALATERVEDGDALVERLAARLARQAASESDAETAPAVNSTKAAAIARAKRRAGVAAQKPDATIVRAETKVAVRKNAAARGLQERLSREFAAKAALTATERQRSDDALDEIGDSLDVSHEPPQLAAVAPQSREPLMTEQKDDPSSSDEPKPNAPQAEENSFVFVEPSLADAPATRNASPAGFAIASLAVANARAFFRPGIRVGVRQPPPASEPAIGTLEDAAEIAITEGAVSPSPDAQPPAFSVPKVEPRAVAQETDANAARDAENFNPEAIAAATAPRRDLKERRKKGFLRRMVVRYPTHFWPTSWKRAYRRWESQKAAARRQEAAE